MNLTKSCCYRSTKYGIYVSTCFVCHFFKKSIFSKIAQKLSPSCCVHNKFWFSVLCEIFMLEGLKGAAHFQFDCRMLMAVQSTLWVRLFPSIVASDAVGGAASYPGSWWAERKRAWYLLFAHARNYPLLNTCLAKSGRGTRNTYPRDSVTYKFT